MQQSFEDPYWTTAAAAAAACVYSGLMNILLLLRVEMLKTLVTQLRVPTSKSKVACGGAGESGWRHRLVEEEPQY